MVQSPLRRQVQGRARLLRSQRGLYFCLVPPLCSARARARERESARVAANNVHEPVALSPSGAALDACTRAGPGAHRACGVRRLLPQSRTAGVASTEPRPCADARHASHTVISESRAADVKLQSRRLQGLLGRTTLQPLPPRVTPPQRCPTNDTALHTQSRRMPTYRGARAGRGRVT